MTKPDLHRTFQGFCSQRSLFISSLGWLGGISLLSTSLVAYAQTPSNGTSSITVDSSAVPSAQDLFQPTVQPTIREAPTPEEPTFSVSPITPEEFVSSPQGSLQIPRRSLRLRQAVG
ncbi:MAG: hypothetical protein HC772_08490 [Leptolyngbyaceae cyanobacterium CRU_2_3]|nr:hypothetical protein [Leptolyngbyaceae cyanobacterium CRU_2_3]